MAQMKLSIEKKHMDMPTYSLGSKKEEHKHSKNKQTNKKLLNLVPWS